jgi:hypothetical protein
MRWKTATSVRLPGCSSATKPPPSRPTLLRRPPHPGRPGVRALPTPGCYPGSRRMAGAAVARNWRLRMLSGTIPR